MGLDRDRTGAARRRSGTGHGAGRGRPADRRGGDSLTRLGPLPPLQMQPDAPPIMSHYRALAFAAIRPRRHRRRTRLVDLAMSDPDRLTLVLRFADVGIATYASLRVVGQPSRTVTWVVEEPMLLAALQELADALARAARVREPA